MSSLSLEERRAERRRRREMEADNMNGKTADEIEMDIQERLALRRREREERMAAMPEDERSSNVATVNGEDDLERRRRERREARLREKLESTMDDGYSSYRSRRSYDEDPAEGSYNSYRSRRRRNRDEDATPAYDSVPDEPAEETPAERRRRQEEEEMEEEARRQQEREEAEERHRLEEERRQREKEEEERRQRELEELEARREEERRKEAEMEEAMRQMKIEEQRLRQEQEEAKRNASLHRGGSYRDKDQIAEKKLYIDGDTIGNREEDVLNSQVYESEKLDRVRKWNEDSQNIHQAVDAGDSLENSPLKKNVADEADSPLFRKSVDEVSGNKSGKVFDTLSYDKDAVLDKSPSPEKDRSPSWNRSPSFDKGGSKVLERSASFKEQNRIKSKLDKFENLKDEEKQKSPVSTVTMGVVLPQNAEGLKEKKLRFEAEKAKCQASPKKQLPAGYQTPTAKLSDKLQQFETAVRTTQESPPKAATKSNIMTRSASPVRELKRIGNSPKRRVRFQATKKPAWLIKLQTRQLLRARGILPPKPQNTISKLRQQFETQKDSKREQRLQRQQLLGCWSSSESRIHRTPIAKEASPTKKVMDKWKSSDYQEKKSQRNYTSSRDESPYKKRLSGTVEFKTARYLEKASKSVEERVTQKSPKLPARPTSPRSPSIQLSPKSPVVHQKTTITIPITNGVLNLGQSSPPGRHSRSRVTDRWQQRTEGERSSPGVTTRSSGVSSTGPGVTVVNARVTSPRAGVTVGSGQVASPGTSPRVTSPGTGARVTSPSPGTGTRVTSTGTGTRVTSTGTGIGGSRGSSPVTVFTTGSTRVCSPGAGGSRGSSPITVLATGGSRSSSPVTGYTYGGSPGSSPVSGLAYGGSRGSSPEKSYSRTSSASSERSWRSSPQPDREEESRQEAARQEKLRMAEESKKRGKRKGLGGLTPEKKKLLKDLLDYEYDTEEEEEKVRVLFIRVPELPDDFDYLSSAELRKLCKQLHDRLVTIHSEVYDWEYKVGKQEQEITELTMKVNDAKGKFVKPVLRKVNKSTQ